MASLSVEIHTELARSKPNGKSFRLDISFTVTEGINVLFGPSGSGKSTTLAVIAGILLPTHGRVQIGERVLLDRALGINIPIQQRSIGILFQNLALFEHMSTLSNIMYGLTKMTRAEREQRARVMLSRFGIIHLAERRPAQLSGGERQRVALARTLVTEPSVLLLDEPFSALDLPTKTSIMEELRQVAQLAAIPVLLVTHDRAEAVALGQHMLVYEDGQIVAQGAPLAVLGAPRTLSVASLAGIENIFVGQIASLHPERGTMSVQAGSILFEMPLSERAIGESVHIAISARDILLATERPLGISARNILPGTIIELQEHGLNLYIRVDCGITLLALVTKHAAEELALHCSQQVWLAFKAHSCYLLARPD
ncbi:MAG: ATP-binding cassette domain-containing protein [Acidobacteriota bacterium]